MIKQTAKTTTKPTTDTVRIIIIIIVIIIMFVMITDTILRITAVSDKYKIFRNSILLELSNIARVTLSDSNVYWPIITMDLANKFERV